MSSFGFSTMPLFVLPPCIFAELDQEAPDGLSFAAP
jgi:hypothetical protein